MTSEIDQYDEIGEMISRFPAPLYLKVDKNRSIGALYIFIPLFIASVFAIFEGSSLQFRLGGGFLAFVFGVITVFSVLALNVRDYYLVLDKDGFTMRWWFYKSSYRWNCVEKFAPFSNPFSLPFESRDFTEIGVSFRWLDDSKSKHGRRAAVTRIINNTYGLPVSELIRLLTGWQKRALELAGSISPSGTSP